MSLRVEAADQEKQVLAYVRGADLNLTENRRTILAVFLAGTQSVTTIDLWLQAKKADPRVSYGTVWRLLNALVECGLAQRAVSPADGILRYGPVKVECTHERVACKDCGATIFPRSNRLPDKAVRHLDALFFSLPHGGARQS